MNVVVHYRSDKINFSCELGVLDFVQQIWSPSGIAWNLLRLERAKLVQKYEKPKKDFAVFGSFQVDFNLQK